MSGSLRNPLADGQGVLEEPDMEERQLELDVAEVARAFRHFFVARAARGGLVRDPEPLVQDPVRRRLPSGHAVKLLRPHAELADLLHVGGGHERELNLADPLRHLTLATVTMVVSPHSRTSASRGTWNDGATLCVRGSHLRMRGQ